MNTNSLIDRAADLLEDASLEQKMSAINDWLESTLPSREAADMLHDMFKKAAAASGIRMARYPGYLEMLKRFPAKEIEKIYQAAIMNGMPEMKAEPTSVDSYSYKSKVAADVKRDKEAVAEIYRLYNTQKVDPKVAVYNGSNRIWNLTPENYLAFLEFLKNRKEH
jgi:hypothetical protein